MKGIKAWWQRRAARLSPARAQVAVDERQRAIDLVAAIDRGGLPLNPLRVNATARSLGLEVSLEASMDDTIERIRQALVRSADTA